MRITVNGEKKETELQNIKDLLLDSKLTPSSVVVELNGVILSQEQFATTSIHENDSLEIVHFVGGG